MQGLRSLAPQPGTADRREGEDPKQLTCYARERIGPHNIDIISIIAGSLLSAQRTQLEKRNNGVESGTRVIFEQSNKNVEYLM